MIRYSSHLMQKYRERLPVVQRYYENCIIKGNVSNANHWKEEITSLSRLIEGMEKVKYK